MTVISYLILSVILFIVMIVVQALLGTKQYGLGTLAGPRDSMAEPNVMSGRAKRANQNMVEAMVLFVPLAAVAMHAGVAGATLGAAIFFWARLAYAPLYWFGIPWARTLAWAVSVVGLLLMILALMPLI
ncbi:MAPEG family protein [Robiginitomaculum antarcticum]|uniref:MAPEG family protein n=1 Tax=Robiginitomaculum antarcticum TaxID=437507 RepID=UPI00035DC3C9|nr:MAPEG family protein [Robiginitomaculum antarcticum]